MGQENPLQRIPIESLLRPVTPPSPLPQDATDQEQRHVMTRDERIRAKQAFDLGMSVKEISETMNINLRSVYRAVRSNSYSSKAKAISNAVKRTGTSLYYCLCYCLKNPTTNDIRDALEGSPF